MSYITAYQYYENGGNAPENENWGSYQYVSLPDIVNNFMLMYQGNHELINNLNRYQVLFYAKRGIQELNYDAFKEIKILQLDVSSNLRFILPQDYVNWVRLSHYKNGVLFPMTENFQTNYSGAYLQDNSANILFDEDGQILKPQNSKLDLDRITSQTKSLYLNTDNQFDGELGYLHDGLWYFDYAIGARYGLNTETANRNKVFKIDNKGGVINFNSDMSGESCILEYVSDGMETTYDSATSSQVVNDDKITVNKLFEDYIYAFIRYSILNNRLGVQEYVVRRAQKDKSSLLRNAKIRLSNIHPGKLLMTMRGQDKIIK